METNRGGKQPHRRNRIKILSAVFSVSGKSYYRFRFRPAVATLSAPRVTCAKLQHFDRRRRRRALPEGHRRPPVIILYVRR